MAATRSSFLRAGTCIYIKLDCLNVSTRSSQETPDARQMSIVATHKKKRDVVVACCYYLFSLCLSVAVIFFFFFGNRDNDKKLVGSINIHISTSLATVAPNNNSRSKLYMIGSSPIVKNENFISFRILIPLIFQYPDRRDLSGTIPSRVNNIYAQTMLDRDKDRQRQVS